MLIQTATKEKQDWEMLLELSCGLLATVEKRRKDTCVLMLRTKPVNDIIYYNQGSEIDTFYFILKLLRRCFQFLKICFNLHTNLHN